MALLHSAVSPDGATLVLHLRVAAPRAAVFEALLSPAALPHFYPPPGFAMLACEVEPWLAGSYAYTLGDAAGRRMGVRGTFLAVEPGVRVQHTEEYDFVEGQPELLVTLSLADAPGGGATDVQLAVRHPSAEACAAQAAGLASGVAGCYARLEALLRQRLGSR